MRRNFRKLSINQKRFIYEDYNLISEELPDFMRIPLNDIHISIDDKERLLNEIFYKYLDDKEFRKNINGKVMVFDGSKYIDYTDENNVFL